MYDKYNNMAAAKSSVSGDGVTLQPPSRGGQRGGMITVPFIIASFTGMAIAGGGWLSNLIVFLISQFNIKSINAAQINNVVFGTSSFLPVVAAILADSFLGCFSVIWISSLISLMGLTLLVLTVTVDGLKPSDSATAPSTTQYAVLFTAMTLVSIGQGGTRFTLATMGAKQLTRTQQQATYFNWYFLSMYVCAFVSATGIVYIEDNVSWALGFGISIVGNVIALMVFLLGRRYYCCRESGNGSPFTGFAQVLVAAFRKRKSGINSSRSNADYYHGDDKVRGLMALESPTNSFRLLNRAALETEGDILPNGSIDPWKLCSVQQVEDLKSVIRILPLWSTSILLSTPIGIQASLTVLQALNTDRHLGRRFQVPAGSVIVVTFLTTSIFLSLFDHCLWPMWRKVFGRNPTPLQQIGFGHVLTVASMAISAMVESKRRREGPDQMTVLWLVPQLMVVGIGEAFHFPGQVRLYYREFPVCLKSMATAMIAMLIGIAYFLSTVVTDIVRRVTGWLPDNIDDGRVDNIYWVCVVLGFINFGYYLVCSWFYKCKSDIIVEEDQILT